MCPLVLLYHSGTCWASMWGSVEAQKLVMVLVTTLAHTMLRSPSGITRKTGNTFRLERPSFSRYLGRPYRLRMNAEKMYNWFMFQFNNNYWSNSVRTLCVYWCFFLWVCCEAEQTNLCPTAEWAREWMVLHDTLSGKMRCACICAGLLKTTYRKRSWGLCLA